MKNLHVINFQSPEDRNIRNHNILAQNKKKKYKYSGSLNENCPIVA